MKCVTKDSITLKVLAPGCSKHMTGDRSRLRNFVKKFIGTVRFGNDHFGAIMGYGDYVIGDNMISRVYYVEGLGHNLFSVVNFVILGSCGSNLYTISAEDMLKSSPICLLSKASKNKSWLWHRHLKRLNFGTINELSKKDLVRGLPRLKFEKDHLCSVCQLGKSKKDTHKPKAKNTNLEVLNTLHMDLCRPMRVQTINRKKYVLVIIDDYSRQNHTLVEAARTMLIFFKASMFLWAEAVATACYTQNRSLIHTRYNKTSYDLVHDKKPDLTFLCVFGALCYPTNDSEDLGKFQSTADIRILVGYELIRKEPPRVERSVSPTTAVPVISAGTPSSTTIDQEAPSLIHSPSSSALQSLCLHHGVAAGSTSIEGNHLAHVNNDPFVNMFALKPSFEASTSGDVSSVESTHVTQPHHHLGK
nr:hypothetical protein [Tanacetum cinerariifolium]